MSLGRYCMYCNNHRAYDSKYREQSFSILTNNNLISNKTSI